MPPSQRTRQVTDRQIALAAAELSSQERHNPAWCKPGVGTSDHNDSELYRQRARMILEAAFRSLR